MGNIEKFPSTFEALIISSNGRSMKGLQKDGKWLDIDLTDKRWLLVKSYEPIIILIQRWIKFWNN